MGQAGADDDQRRALLGQLVAGGADGGDVVGLQVLHLVDEQRDAAADVGGDAGGVAEQLDQVDLHVAGVGPAGGRRARRCRAASGRAPWRRADCPQRERLEDAEHLVDRVLVAVRGPARAAPCAARRRPAGAATGRAGPRSCRCPSRGAIAADRSWLSSTVLPTPRSPVSTRERSGPAVGDPLQDDVEGRQLRVAAGQLGRALAGAGGVRVPHGIHVEHRMAFSSPNRRHP